MQDFAESNADGTEIIVQPCRDAEILTADWQFTLFELATSHYAATCVKKKDTSVGGINVMTHSVKHGLLPNCFPQDNSAARGEENSLKLKVWKVIPFVSDEYVSGTKDVIPIIGLS
ncbi:hypothetical protein Taro_027218 [Colocasia esculenta]|uniref:Uncharacterized protein n=1 Tax=Colocasia esculenta TaxID=4460 RepID=A0A843VDE0_COLES|nr:hypothetical protein [Colocasia esculenta]